ncbi:MAG: hypothetical protein ACKOE5_01225, partial [Cytophagales bacterium]
RKNRVAQTISSPWSKRIPLSDKKVAYRRLIMGYFKIVYYVDGESVYITSIFDTRQDPEKLKTIG